MGLSDLFSAAVQGVERRTGVQLLRHHLTDGARRDLGLNVVGRIVVAMGLALGDGLSHVNSWADDVLRRQHLAQALLGVAELAVLNGISSDELERTLEMLE
jgi:uncharacterized membrane protein